MQESTISATNLNSPDAGASRSLLRTFAAGVSAVFSPPLLTTVMLAILGFMLNSRAAWLWLASYAIVSTLVPSLMIVWMVRRGTVSDFHMRNRDERSRPLFVIFLLSSILCLVFYFGGAPRVITALAAGACFQALVMWLVTTKWKISGHSAGAASFLAILIALDGSLALPAILLLGLVIWARVLRSRHTLLQTVAGTALGFFSIWVPLQILEPFCSGHVLACF